MRVVAQLAEFWKNFGPDKHAACGQRPAWHDSVRSLALAKFTGSLSMVTTRHPGSHSSTLPVEMLPVGEDPARQFCFNHFDFPPRGRGDAKIIEYEYLADDSLSLFGSSRVRSIFLSPDRGVRVDPCYFFLFFYWNLSPTNSIASRKFLQNVLLIHAGLCASIRFQR